MECGRIEDEDFALQGKSISLFDEKGVCLLKEGVLEEGISTMDLDRAEEASLTFVNQKNLEKNETIREFRHNCYACPVAMLILLAKDVRLERASGDDFLRSLKDDSDIHREEISSFLWNLLETSGLSMDEAKEYNIHSLRRAGACYWASLGLPFHLIKYKGRWKSDAALAYLQSYLLVGGVKDAARLTFSQSLPDKEWFVSKDEGARMKATEDCRMSFRPPDCRAASREVSSQPPSLKERALVSVNREESAKKGEKSTIRVSSSPLRGVQPILQLECSEKERGELPDAMMVDGFGGGYVTAGFRRG